MARRISTAAVETANTPITNTAMIKLGEGWLGAGWLIQTWVDSKRCSFKFYLVFKGCPVLLDLLTVLLGLAKNRFAPVFCFGKIDQVIGDRCSLAASAA